nr:MAG TPA: hypothetical protein [Caudoviricetes sp.]
MQLPLGNSPTWRGFVIFTRLRANEHIPPLPANAFHSFHSPGLYVAFPAGWECQNIPPLLASDGSIPLRSTTILQGLHGKILLMTTSPVIPGSR